MNKNQTKRFLTDYIHQLDPECEMSKEAFEMIFNILDINGDEMISREELAMYIKVFTKW